MVTSTEVEEAREKVGWLLAVFEEFPGLLGWMADIADKTTRYLPDDHFKAPLRKLVVVLAKATGYQLAPFAKRWEEYKNTLFVRSYMKEQD